MMNLNKYGYYGEEPKPRFNTDFYTGDDKYSDGDIENEVIKIIAQNNDTDYEEVISKNYSWPVFYHLTKIRQNLLNWYPFKKNSNVLEIGCGMGAITELLCKKCESVTAVELSERRATGTYLRCRNYNNLEIIVGNLNDIKFEKKYDYITLIGVLEYQNNFTESENPFKDFLAKIRNLLNPNGKLLIAIENKMGLKYWCGAPEDHSGIPFDGLNNYRFSNVARTFSKKNLDQIIKSSGFSDTYFYYPLPDYKMPQVIYSQKYLPHDGSMDNWIPYYQPSNKSMTIDEESIFSDIVENDMFEFFANSFLVECSDKGTDLGEVIYATCSPFRKKEYSMMTILSSKDGFHKIAIEQESEAALKNIYNNHNELKNMGIGISEVSLNGNILDMTTVKGMPLTHILIDTYKNGKIEEVYKILGFIYDEIKRSSKGTTYLNEVLCSYGLNEKNLDVDDKILENAFIDMIHKNCFVDENGGFVWIDQEWCINGVPASYVLFYNIIELYSSNSYLNKYLSIKDVLGHYNLTDKYDIYFQFKNDFLYTVQNRCSAYNYSQLSNFDGNNITKSIKILYDNLQEKDERNNTEIEVDHILQTGTIMDVIEYVSTLSDEIILKDIPKMPQFIVKYVGTNEQEKIDMQKSIKRYNDIRNM